MQASVLGLVDHAHTAAAKLFDNAVVQDRRVNHGQVTVLTDGSVQRSVVSLAHIGQAIRAVYVLGKMGDAEATEATYKTPINVRPSYRLPTTSECTAHSRTSLMREVVIGTRYAG